MSSDDAKIGIVGGAGPYAGLDLAQKILQQTRAKIDQDYLPTISISTPADIADRTRFLLGQTTKNPAHAIFRNLTELEDLGAQLRDFPATPHMHLQSGMYSWKSSNNPEAASSCWT